MTYTERGAKRYWRDGLRAVVLIFGLLLTMMAPASTVQVIGVSGSGESTFLSALTQELGASYTVVTAESSAASDIIVVLHEGALQESRRRKLPTLVVLPEPGHVALEKDESALYWAPSWTDQLHLAKMLFPSLRRVGLLLDDPSYLSRARALREQAKAMGVELLVKDSRPEVLVRSVAELAGASDVLMAPADSSAFTRNTIKPVLLAAYRQGRVFIGPTPAVVRAGALAALHVTPEILAENVAERIRRREQDGRWGEASRVSRFNVTTNPQVARSLGIKLLDQEPLSRQWRMREGTPWP